MHLEGKMERDGLILQSRLRYEVSSPLKEMNHNSVEVKTSSYSSQISLARSLTLFFPPFLKFRCSQRNHIRQTRLLNPSGLFHQNFRNKTLPTLGNGWEASYPRLKDSLYCWLRTVGAGVSGLWLSLKAANRSSQQGRAW